MDIIFYTTGCPKCSVLKNKLDAANISYKINTDVDLMIEKNIKNAPALEIDGTIYSYKEAIHFINEVTKK